MDDDREQLGLAQTWITATVHLRGDDLPVPDRSWPRPDTADATG